MDTRTLSPAKPNADSRLKERLARKDGHNRWTLAFGFASLAFFPCLMLGILWLGPVDEPLVRTLRAYPVPVATGTGAPAGAEAPGQGVDEAGASLSPLRSGRLEFGQFFRPEDPAEICEGLAADGLPNEGWNGSPISAGEWECLSQASGTPDASADPNTIFFALRGPSETEINTAFVKLNIHDAENTAAVTDKAKAVIARLGMAFGRPVPAKVADAVLSLEEIDMTKDDLSFSFRREYGDVERFNLRVVQRAVVYLKHEDDAAELGGRDE